MAVSEIVRADAEALINEQDGTEIWQEAVHSSAALRTFRRATMSSKKKRQPVIDVLPSAGWVGETTSTRRKPTSRMKWRNKYFEAEELAVIVPIPEAVLEDSEYDIWGEVRPRVAEAIGEKIDAAVFFGIEKPITWPDSIVEGAIAAGNVHILGTGDGASTTIDLAADLNATMSIPEEDGFDTTQWWSYSGQRRMLRGLRDDNGQPIYVTSIRDGGPVNEVWGVPIDWVRNGAWLTPSDDEEVGALFIAGQRDNAIIAVRRDMEFKFLDQATLTERAENGDLLDVVSLAEEDMVALRCRMRLGFQVADPTTKEGGEDAYPFAVLQESGS